MCRALLVPVDAHPVADPQVRHARAQLGDLAHRLVPGHQRRPEWEHAVVDVEVGPAQPAGADADEHLAGLGARVGERAKLPGPTGVRPSDAP